MGYDTDVMIVAVVGKLLVFALAFLLLWFGNRRGWKWAHHPDWKCQYTRLQEVGC